MKKIITLLLFVFLYHIGFSQVWQRLDSIANNERNRSGSFAIGGKGYIVAGGNTWYINDAWAYDTASNTWTQVTSYPSDSDDGVVGFAINGIGYMGTGAYCCYEYGSAFFKYDPTAGAGGTWTRMPNFPGQGRAFAVSFMLDGKGYIGGGLNGYNNNPLTDFYCYDPVANKWTQIANCPAAGVSFRAVAFTIGDKAYLGTGGQQQSAGSSTFVPQSDFWEYDTTSKAWTQVTSYGGPPMMMGVAFATCDKGYVGTGCTDAAQQHYTKEFWQYDPSIGSGGTWTRTTDFSGTPRVSASAFAIGKTGYVGFGVDTTSYHGTLEDDFFKFTQTVTPAFSADSSVCSGGSIAFTDTSDFSPTYWQWTFPGGKPNSSSSQSPTVEYDTAGTYDVIFTAWNGGCDSATKVFTNYITVTTGPTVNVTPDSPSVCNGQHITLKASGGMSFQWLGTSDTTDSISVNPSIDTTYELKVSNGSCSSDTLIGVIVKQAPALIIQPPSPVSVCLGQNITLSVPTSGTNYTWIPSSTLSSSTVDTVVATPVAQTTYVVTGIDSLGCSVTSDSEVVTINTGPSKPTISQHDSVLISSSTQSNQWLRNDTIINGATNQDYVVVTQGYYQVTVSNPANGCSTTSDSIYDKPTGVNQLTVESGQVTVYPNPTGGEIFVTINSAVAEVKDWNLIITDVLGRTVFTKSPLNPLKGTFEIDLSNLSSGVYFITVINKTGRVVVPITKQN